MAPDVRIERVRVLADSMQLWMVRGQDTVHVGRMWDSLTFFADHAGGPAVRRVYRTVNDAFGPEHDIYFYRLPDLGPISVASDGGDAGQIEYRGGRVMGWTERAGRRRTVDREIAPGVYDGSVFDLLVRADDLREGYSVKVRAYLDALNVVRDLRAEVVGTELIEVADGRRVETWIVEMDFAGLLTTLWIDKETRSVARQIIHMGAVSMLMNRVAPHDPSLRES